VLFLNVPRGCENKQAMQILEEKLQITLFDAISQSKDVLLVYFLQPPKNFKPRGTIKHGNVSIVKLRDQ
jgi:hypothetical protein